MELALYSLVAMMGLIFSVRQYLLRSDFWFFCLWTIIFVSLSLVVRMEYDADLVTYEAAMSLNLQSIYYWREPLVWIGQRYLFRLTESSYFTFFIYDIAAGLSVFLALRKLGAPQYFYFSILLFFPFILGMQNIYRQWISSIFFLLAFSYSVSGESRVKTIFFFLLAFASHNLAAVFLPILFLRTATMAGKFGWLFLLMISVLGVYYASDTKSSANTGADLSLVYLFLILLLPVVYAVLDRGRVNRADYALYRLLISILIIAASSVAFLSSSGAERVVMFALTVIFPMISIRIEQRVFGAAVARMMMTLLGFVPILLFGTSSFIIG